MHVGGRLGACRGYGGAHRPCMAQPQSVKEVPAYQLLWKSTSTQATAAHDKVKETRRDFTVNGAWCPGSGVRFSSDGLSITTWKPCSWAPHQCIVQGGCRAVVAVQALLSGVAAAGRQPHAAGADARIWCSIMVMRC
jgi:hypothetical protein